MGVPAKGPIRSPQQEAPRGAGPHDIERAEKVSDRFVSRMMRLAYLSPDLLKRLVVKQAPPIISVAELIDTTYPPRAGLMGRVSEKA